VFFIRITSLSPYERRPPPGLAGDVSLIGSPNSPPGLWALGAPQRLLLVPPIEGQCLPYFPLPEFDRTFFCFLTLLAKAPRFTNPSPHSAGANPSPVLDRFAFVGLPLFPFSPTPHTLSTDFFKRGTPFASWSFSPSFHPLSGRHVVSFLFRGAVRSHSLTFLFFRRLGQQSRPLLSFGASFLSVPMMPFFSSCSPENALQLLVPNFSNFFTVFDKQFLPFPFINFSFLVC